MSSSNAAIEIVPDSCGNITVTIKLVIKAPRVDGGRAPEEAARADLSAETPGSENLLQSDESTVVDESNDNVSAFIPTPTSHGRWGQSTQHETPYSLRSRVRVEDDDSEEEVDWQLSQQISNVKLSNDD